MTAGTIVGGAFRVLKENPGAVLVWIVIYTLAAAGMALWMQSSGLQTALYNPDVQSDPAAWAASFGWLLLIQLAFFFLFMILFTASQRATLLPRESGFAYLRLGMDELRAIGLAVFLIIIFYFGLVIATIAMTLLMGIFALAAGAVAGVALVIGFLALFAVLVWLQVRLSLVFPLTLIRKKLIIGQSWQLTRGRFWTLFGGYVIVFLVVLVLVIVASTLSAGYYFSDLLSGGFTPENVEAATEKQLARQAAGVDAMTVATWLLSGVSGAVMIALMGGAVASATRALISTDDEIRQTFS